MLSTSDLASSTSPLLILASASPRRRVLLAQLALPFTVMPADIDEQPLPAETPRAYVRRIALAKAQHLAQLFPAAVVVGADTIVVLDEQILGKPHTAVAAQHMLRRLSGRQHTVLTAVAVVQQVRHVAQLDVVSTQVHFRPLQEMDIERYVATGEPLDKAGGYAIQGEGAAFVASLDGCYTNVVGLPLQRTAALLRSVGLAIPPRIQGNATAPATTQAHSEKNAC